MRPPHTLNSLLTRLGAYPQTLSAQHSSGNQASPSSLVPDLTLVCLQTLESPLPHWAYLCFLPLPEFIVLSDLGLDLILVSLSP